MTQPMKLQFRHQDYQAQAVDAVVKVFDGQPLARSDYTLATQQSSVIHAADGSVGNALNLSEEQLLANVKKVQASQSVEPSKALLGEEGVPHFSLEMETGTGKTYVFIKTIYELHKVYGFKKFVVVVPSVAIREGTMKNLDITKEHFAADYERVPFVHVLYDSSQLSHLRDFANSDALSVLVINIDSFTKDNNKINQKGEMPFAPIQYIRAVNPIVIMDEPQNFETDIRRHAVLSLNPLCTLRYSATHRNPYNLLYSLNPVQAYDLGLVKQIEVDGVKDDPNHNQAFVQLLRIEPRANTMTAKVLMDVNEKSSVKRKEVRLKVGDDLFEKSKGREVYQSGYVLNDFLSDEMVGFSGGRTLRLNEAQGNMRDDVMRYQIERTVLAHFTKMKRFKEAGLQIKVLSLFFIDKVANYRSYDADGNYKLGRFGHWFEEAFAKYTAMPAYKGLINHSVEKVHDGYFSGDKKGKGAQAKTVWVDSTERGSAKDDSTYELIMRHKERLLGMDEPRQFIFSHSALREGWDNPNVFQICTLNESLSVMKKRQELGRGLRLCVDQSGQRVMDKKINTLTVIANQSFEAFAKGLQQEIEDETGVKFEGRLKDAKAKARLTPKTMSHKEMTLFKAIWDKINYETRYSVKLETPELVKACVKLLRNTDQYPRIQIPKLRSEKGVIHITRQGVEGMRVSVGENEMNHYRANVPDVYVYIQNKLHLSRETLFTILDESKRLDELLLNPQAFLDMIVAAIQNVLKEMMVSGIEYHEIEGMRYQMRLLEEESEAYLSGLFPKGADSLIYLDKTLLQAQVLDDEGQPDGKPFECVAVESTPETRFAEHCQINEEVKFFFKLPKQFKIDTPLGTYNPDWAVVFEKEKQIYFVVETKSSLVEAERRRDENLKIACGLKHFSLREDVTFTVATALGQLL